MSHYELTIGSTNHFLISRYQNALQHINANTLLELNVHIDARNNNKPHEGINMSKTHFFDF